VLINIGRLGMPRDGDTIDIERADVGACKDAIARNRDTVVGIKARLSKEIAGPNDYEALRRAEEVSRAFNIPVMIHMGGSVTPLGKLIDLMKKGDIVSHMYAPPPNAIIGDDGKLIPEVIAARARGVMFDIGNGRGGHVRWDIAQKAIAQGFFPDTYSSDWTMAGHKAGTVAIPFNMSYMLNLGASLNDVVAACTIHAANCFPAFKGRGTLAIGSPADVAILELQQGKFEFADTFANMLPGTQKLVCRNTVLGGKVVV
jgi:dihydroorotase